MSTLTALLLAPALMLLTPLGTTGRDPGSDRQPPAGETSRRLAQSPGDEHKKGEAAAKPASEEPAGARRRQGQGQGEGEREGQGQGQDGSQQGGPPHRRPRGPGARGHLRWSAQSASSRGGRPPGRQSAHHAHGDRQEQPARARPSQAARTFPDRRGHHGARGHRGRRPPEQRHPAQPQQPPRAQERRARLALTGAGFDYYLPAGGWFWFQVRRPASRASAYCRIRRG